jgi:ferredoxin
LALLVELRLSVTTGAHLAQGEANMHVYLRGPSQQRLRLASGLVLFGFAATHFLNHAAGLISLELMHDIQSWRVWLTRSWPGTVILAAALLTHMALALYKISQRGTLRMPWWEMLQILIALAIPVLLLPHIVNTRVAAWRFGVADSYLYELYRLWPERGITQITLLLLVWVHSCLGLHYWLRLSDGYHRVAPLLIALALAIPALAIAGFVAAGQTTAEIMTDPVALSALKERAHWPNDADSLAMLRLRDWLRWSFGAAVALALAIPLRRHLSHPSLPALTPSAAPTASDIAVTISYHDGPTVIATAGMTLLEISRSHGIAHASVCGGRQRCGTCRVRVLAGQDRLPPPGPTELATLGAVRATANMRLACAIRPAAALSVDIVLRPEDAARSLELFEVADLVAVHQEALFTDRPLAVDATDRDRFDAWLVARIGRLLAVQPSASSNVRLLGARIDYLHDRQMVALVYTEIDAIISVLIVPRHHYGDRDDAIAISGQKDGFSVLGWSDEAQIYYAVAALPPATLQRLVEWLRGGTRTAIDVFDVSAAP